MLKIIVKKWNVFWGKKKLASMREGYPLAAVWIRNMVLDGKVSYKEIGTNEREIDFACAAYFQQRRRG